MKMATLRQKKAALKYYENLRTESNDKRKTLGQILLASGYSEQVAKHPSFVVESRGFKETLNALLRRLKVDKNSRIEILAEIMNERNEKGRLSDKRSVIAANQEITKMLGEYAPNQMQIVSEQEARDKVLED